MNKKLGPFSFVIDRLESSFARHRRGFGFVFDRLFFGFSSGQDFADATRQIAFASAGGLGLPDRDYYLKDKDERYAKAVASAIIAARKTEPFSTSTQLAGLIAKVIPFIPGKSSGHPAKRVFQALRIEVNGELEVLTRTMPAAIKALTVGGRVVVLSYHSLEDRIVKQALAAAATSSAPLELPFELPEHAPVVRLLVKGAEPASVEEIAQNPRAASVRLRAAEKIRRAA